MRSIFPQKNRDARAERRRISAPHGLSHYERDMLTEGLDRLRRKGPALFVSIEAGRSSTSEMTVRKLTRRVRSDIAKLQRRAGMRHRLAVTVFEALGRDGLPKFGAHVVAAIMPNVSARDKAIESLNGSRAYAAYGSVDRPSVLAKPVSSWRELTTYLLKEATPQAAYRKDLRRIGGSIPLGVLGGDRVILSGDLGRGFRSQRRGERRWRVEQVVVVGRSQDRRAAREPPARPSHRSGDTARSGRPE